MEYTYDAEINGVRLKITTDGACFSPKSPDRGTLAMLSCVTIAPGEKVIDLGCGCGIVGIYCSRFTQPENVYMLDCDEISVKMAEKNAEANGAIGAHVMVSDAYSALDCAGFDIILSNPPYHTDFSVAKRFIEKGFNRLKLGGRMVMVTKRLDWYKNKLTAVFGGCRVEQKDGYFVFTAEKRSDTYSRAKKKQYNK